jgi:hypothetical protein
MTYSVWSTAYSTSTETIEVNRCYVSLVEWRRIHDEMPEARRIFARLIVDEKSVFCPLGEPIDMAVFATEGAQPVIVPDWVREILYIEGSGESVEIMWMAEDSFPNATRVVLRPHDSAFYHADAREELERALTSYGVIAEGTTIPIVLNVLGGFSVQMDVIQTEPANIVLLEGDEIVFEFEGALDAEVEEPAALPLEPAALEPAALEPAALPLEPEQILEPPPKPVGQLIGGTNRPLLPDGRAWNPWR